MKTDNINEYKKRNRRFYTSIIILVGILFLLISFSLVYGNTIYSPSTVIKVLLGEDIDGAVFTIKTLRLPRTLGAVLVGFSFGMAGFVFQSILRNPLASPDIIGVSSGTSLVAVFCIIFLRVSGGIVSLVSVIAGLLVALVIYLLSSYNGFSKGKMVLIGIGTQAFFRAMTSFILLKASEYDVGSTMKWLNGSLNNVEMSEIPILLFVVILAGGGLCFHSKHLSAIELGNEYATTLGVNIKSIYPMLIALAVILVAFSTAVTGPIASVAFLSGPIASKIVGQGRVNLIPSALVGAILILGADMVGQYAFSVRYPVGVITGMLGAPFLLYLLIQMNRKG